MTPLNWFRAGMILLALTAPFGCRYTLGPRTRRIHRTIAVPIFRNDTREREIEIPLTRAVIRELGARGYSLRSRSRASLILQGRIVRVGQVVAAETPADVQEAGSLSVTVEIVLYSSRGREIQRKTLTESGEFARVRGETRFTARRDALDELALAVARCLASMGD